MDNWGWEMITAYLEWHRIPFRYRQIFPPAHSFAESGHANDKQRHRDRQVHDVVHDNLLLTRPEDVTQFLDDEHRLVPHKAVVTLRERGGTDLTVSLPLVILSDDDVRAVEGQDLVFVQWLGEASARRGDFLCTGCIERRNRLQRGSRLP